MVQSELLPTVLERFRLGVDGMDMRNALAEIAMRVTQHEDRKVFRKADGATTMLDHLCRIMEEQSTMQNKYECSEVFGSTWTMDEVQDSLQFTLIGLCHASLDIKMCLQLLDQQAMDALITLYQNLPSTSAACKCYSLETIRNLCYPSPIESKLPTEAVPLLWQVLLHDSKNAERVAAADALCNLAFHSPQLVFPSASQVSSAIEVFFGSDDAALKTSVADLLANLCADTSICLLMLYDLDERKPTRRYKHSGAVYLIELIQKVENVSLKTSMETWAHNLSWSDPESKRFIQKVCLSSFMERFAVGQDIENNNN